MRKRKTHLVCEHLENISSKALEKYQDIIRNYVQGRCGVYALYRRDKVYYVGLASNLRSRLKGHLKDRHRGLWDRFSVYLTINTEHIKELESLILRIALPKGNRVKGSMRGSQDKKRQFARDIKNLQKRELSSLLGRQLSDLVIPPKPAKKLRSELAKFVDRPYQLRAMSRGKLIRARLRRDGLIRYKGKIYTSPSMAGFEAVKKRHGVNGWFFWEFERNPGDWILLNELRRR